MKNNNFYAVNILVLIVAGILSMFLDNGTYWIGVLDGCVSIGALNLVGALLVWDEESPINIKRIKKEVKEDE